ERLAPVLQPGRVVGEVTPGLDLGGEIGQAELHLLELPDPATELAPLVHVAHGGLEGTSARPSESAATPIRPASSVFMKLTKPKPSAPRRWSSGTITFSRRSS